MGTYVIVDGQRVASAVAADLARMEVDFRRDTGCDLFVTSGTRTDQEQIDIFLSRYVLAGAVGGRKVYDTRWWNGKLYYRISSAGTVAVPGTSNHQESGPIGPRAVDIRDSGNDAGVTTRGTVRDKWMERNARNYNFENEGYNFNEAWHKKWIGPDPFGGSTAGGGATGNPVTLAQQAWLNQARGETLVLDGDPGPATLAAVKRYQDFLNANGYATPALVVDGDWGAATQAAHAKYYDVWMAQQAATPPPFPLAAGQYFGPEAGGENSISGWHSNPPGHPGLKQWQQRMADRGWTITVDGLYGPKGATTPTGQTADIAKLFQQEKGLKVDGEIGPATWSMAWTAPITPPGGTTTTPPTTPTEPGEPTPPAVNPDNPRGLPTYTPIYPGAKFALLAPLGDGLRGTKGSPAVAVPIIIDTMIEHRTGNDGDELDWFSYKNSRSSCPNWYIRKDGTVIELIPPGRKPALTGADWNWRSVGWELQGAGDGTLAQLEAVCQLMAWLVSFNGKVLDGTQVVLAFNRTNFICHRDVVATECPGNWWFDRMQVQLDRAEDIWEEKYDGADPEPEPEPEPTPTSVSVEIADLKAWEAALRGVNMDIGGYLTGAGV